MQREVARLRAAGGNGVKPARPGEQNPPPAMVKGKVLKIDPQDGTLLQVSVGTDMGVQKGHTLEVFRLKPRPEYLGRIRIIDTTHDRAMGMLLTPPGGPRRKVEVGDEVTSTLR